MASTSYPYIHLDVFTDHVFGGNQLAVFTRPAGLDTAQMQAITREKNFSECTFVFPPETQGTDVRVRIFTPGKEMPMAGHPTIGTAFALASNGTLRPGQPRTVFGLGVGPVPVDLVWEGGALAFAWMTQLNPTFGAPVADVDVVASVLCVAPEAIRRTGLPVQVVSCGVPFLIVPLATRADVDLAGMDRSGADRLRAAFGPEAGEVFLFSTEEAGDDATAYSRMFAPGLGVAEDPATGAASGPLGSYLVRHGVVPRKSGSGGVFPGEKKPVSTGGTDVKTPPDPVFMTSLQGVKMGRPSRIHIAIDTADGAITRVRVGGQAVVVGEGSIRL